VKQLIFESEDGSTPVEFRVIGTCFDCDERISIYDFPTSIVGGAIESAFSDLSERRELSWGSNQADDLW
jgi:hypothetical protein